MIYPRESAPLFIDCDPGIDDALALLTLLGTPDLEILGISTVGGNVSVELTAMNALRLLELTGKHDIPVGAGMSHPLKRHLTVADHVHGKDGLGEIWLPEPTLGLAGKNGVDLMIEKILSVPEVVLLATAPLTNVATAFVRNPRMKEHIKRVVWMGGSTGGGNVTPAAEYNAWVDPEAARIVLQAGVPVTMIGLNVTHQVNLDRKTAESYMKINNPVAQTTSRMLDFYIRFSEETTGSDLSPLHDIVAAVEAVYPGITRTQAYLVDVETRGEITSGATVVDMRGDADQKTNVDVGIEADAPFVLEAILAALSSFGRKGPIA